MEAKGLESYKGQRVWLMRLRQDTAPLVSRVARPTAVDGQAGGQAGRQAQRTVRNFQ